jgi:hypothetical protein
VNDYAFFLVFFFGTLTLGAWLGYRFSQWQIKRLLSRIELLKLEVQMGRPISYPR